MRTYDAVTLKGAQEASKSVLMVGHQLLFHPVFKKLKALVEKGVLGRIRSIRAERTGPVDLEREPGVLWSYGPHDAAMILSLTGEVPTRVAATGMIAPGLGEVFQLADVNLEFSSGIEASIHLSAIEKRRRRLTVNGDLGAAVFDDTKPGGRLFLVDRSDSGSLVEDMDLETGEPLALELDHFIQCVASREAPLTGPDHAIKVTALLDEAQESLTHNMNHRPFPIHAVHGVQ
jgi:predicted dehydrogenase